MEAIDELATSVATDTRAVNSDDDLPVPFPNSTSSTTTTGASAAAAATEEGGAATEEDDAVILDDTDGNICTICLKYPLIFVFRCPYGGG